MPGAKGLEIATFRTRLGWMALVTQGSTVRQAASGYTSAAEALHALDAALVEAAHFGDGPRELIERLQAFAAGQPDDFRDVRLDLTHLGEFQRKVVAGCRAIGYGKTRSYQDLAVASGSPRAARAVGNTMASNRFPIIVPCHRVISASGALGSYSGPDGVKRKARLLEMEQRTLAKGGKASAKSRPGKTTRGKASRGKIAGV